MGDHKNEKNGVDPLMVRVIIAPERKEENPGR